MHVFGEEGEKRWRIPYHRVKERGGEHDQLVSADGRTLPESEPTYLLPCTPNKIIWIHLIYDSRRLELSAPVLEMLFGIDCEVADLC